MTRCARVIDAASWALHALPEAEAEDYRAHLQTCAICREEVAEMQVVADALPLAAEQFTPPRELGERIMATVSAEAALQRAAREPERAVAPGPQRRRRWGFLGSLRPLPLAAAAAAVLGVGIVAGVLIDTGSGSKATTTRADVVAPGAHAAFVVDGSRAKLRITGLPDAGAGKVYEVWVQHTNAPEPTDALFSVNRRGAADVSVPIAVHKGDQVMVTAEPKGGSQKPTSAPQIIAQV